jgi:CheY-like chemotaxis protein
MTASARAPANAFASPARVLVIDDDAEYRLCVRAILEKANCVVFEAENGLEGLERCRAVHPSIVLLDVVMPVMGGSEFLRAKQADARIMFIPVIVISTQDIGVGTRVVRQLRKPVASDDLITLVKLVVGGTRRGAP